jgi:hypothetical protein
MYPEEAVYLIKLPREIRSTISFPASKIAIVSTGVAGMHVQPVLESYFWLGASSNSMPGPVAQLARAHP